MSQSSPTPQIILFLDSAGQLHAEAPSLNGARNKIDLDDWTVDDLPPPIADALFGQLVRRQNAEAESKQKADALERKRRRDYFALSYEHRILGEERASAAERARSGKPSAKPGGSAQLTADDLANL